jgi:DNA-binding NarL/FixJ family response regulator
MLGSMLRCVIVDDSPDFLAAVRHLLERQGASVVGVAGSAEEALRQVEELRPDVTLLDVNLGEESGFEVARRMVHELGVDSRHMILISTQAEEDYADLVSESPVAGFLSKSTLSVDAIRDVMGRGR